MRVGVVGGGQLGRMLALAGHPLGLTFCFIDPSQDAPMSAVGEPITAAFDDSEALDELAQRSDIVTFEFENVPAAAIDRISEFVPVFPSPRVLSQTQDRLDEKTLFRRLGIATPRFAGASTEKEFRKAVDEIGLPAVAKTRRHGYDGKGQAVIHSRQDADEAWRRLGSAALIVEEFVAFDRELSVIAVRSRGGEEVFYPLVENVHERGILSRSIAPAPSTGRELRSMGEEFARRLLDELEYCGVLALELFQVGDALLANEVAPRVHNSGHWTIEGAVTSQFENHLRAGLDLPLGTTRVPRPAAMVNLIGTTPAPERVLSIPDAHLHLYGKAPAPGRKLGHVTIVADTIEELRTRVEAVEELQASKSVAS